MSDMFLSDEELFALTKRHHTPARVKMLNKMGIQHKIRADNTVAVLRSHVERVFGEKPKVEAGNWKPSWI